MSQLRDPASIPAERATSKFAQWRGAVVVGGGFCDTVRSGRPVAVDSTVHDGVQLRMHKDGKQLSQGRRRAVIHYCLPSAVEVIER